MLTGDRPYEPWHLWEINLVERPRPWRPQSSWENRHPQSRIMTTKDMEGYVMEARGDITSQPGELDVAREAGEGERLLGTDAHLPAREVDAKPSELISFVGVSVSANHIFMMRMLSFLATKTSTVSSHCTAHRRWPLRHPSGAHTYPSISIITLQWHLANPPHHPPHISRRFPTNLPHFPSPCRPKSLGLAKSTERLRAESMRPVFPTLTFPNLWSIGRVCIPR